MTKKNIFLLCIILSLFFSDGYGRNFFGNSVYAFKHSLNKPKHSPRKASIMSACLPGLGQIYNRKYWKVPIVYAGLGTFGYFAYATNKNYKQFKNAYIFRTDDNPTTEDNLPEYSESQLVENVNYYRRFRDLNFVLITVFYALNIVDANVDAHLFTFDVKDDIKVSWAPLIIQSEKSIYSSLGFSVRF
jgi:hypothetical protein